MTNLRPTPIANVEGLVHFVIHRMYILDRATSCGPKKTLFVRVGVLHVCKEWVSCLLIDYLPTANLKMFIWFDGFATLPSATTSQCYARNKKKYVRNKTVLVRSCFTQAVVISSQHSFTQTDIHLTCRFDGFASVSMCYHVIHVFRLILHWV
jgi:hypothetical protein